MEDQGHQAPSARCSIPAVARVWIDRDAIARNRPRVELAQKTLVAPTYLEPVFRVMRPDGTETVAHSVLLNNGVARLRYDPFNPLMHDKATAWLETSGDLLADSEHIRVRARGSTPTPHLHVVEGALG